MPRASLSGSTTVTAFALIMLWSLDSTLALIAANNKSLKLAPGLSYRFCLESLNQSFIP